MVTCINKPSVVSTRRVVLYFQYLFVDIRHRLIFTSRDDCLTFVRSSVSFKPDEISFHSVSSEVVLAYDDSTKKVILFWSCILF